ncbi:MAG: hypothetical protein ABIY71_07160 [Flavobacteriales bacterium]
MKALSFKEPWLNSTLEKMLGLSTTTKRAIIRALERSLEGNEKRNVEPKPTSMDAFGKWVGDGTADELAESIRSDRYDREKDLDL